MWTGRTVLVTGGTGFLGSAIVRKLACAGADVRVAVRNPEKSHLLADPRIRLMKADLADPTSFRPALDGAEIVIHTAVSYGSYQQQLETNRNGTAALAHESVAAGVQRFIHVSSLAVFGMVGHTIVTEEAIPLPSHDPYTQTKLAAERALQSIDKLSWTIVRPGAIYGPDSSLWTKSMFRLAIRKPFVFIGAGNGLVPLIYVDDVVDCCLLAGLAPNAHQQAFNLVNEEMVTWRRFLSQYALLANQTLVWHGLPTAVLQPVTGLLRKLAPHPSAAASLHEMLHYLDHAPRYSTTHAKERLNWQPEVDLQTGMAQCAIYLRSQGLLA